MKSFIHSAALLAAFALPSLSHAAFITGDITDGGEFAGAVTQSNAWAESVATDGQDVNFWTLQGHVGDKISVSVTSDMIEFGLSLYQGAIDELELAVFGFNNTGSFGDNVFLAGTPFFGAIGTQLIDIILPSSGLYTLAVGGESFGFGEAFTYDMKVTHVPEPATLLLFGSALLGMGLARRKQLI